MNASTINRTKLAIGWFIVKNLIKVAGPFPCQADAVAGVSALGEEFELLVPKLSVVFGSCNGHDVGHRGGSVTQINMAG